jgi:hypothetical protein
MDKLILNFLRSLIPLSIGGVMAKDFILMCLIGQLLVYVLNAKLKYNRINLFGKAKNDN